MFNKDFLLGTATAAAQIEGGFDADGRTPSIWDNCASRALGGHTPHDACNHYNMLERDLSLIADLGLDAYRFSLSWSRLFPENNGKLNQKGADFYNRLIDGLLKINTQPFVTLYHWDLPQYLNERGGFLNRDIAERFGDYAEKCAKLFGDRVKNIITFNEFEVFLGAGYHIGEHAPFYKLPNKDAFLAAHHALLANGIATQKIRAQNAKINIGQAFALAAKLPKTNSNADISAAKSALFENSGCHLGDAWFLEAIINGSYLEKRLVSLDATNSFNPSDLKIINQKPDFIGVNTYFGEMYQADENGKPVRVALSPNTDYTSMEWPILPDCLYWNARFLHERYRLPLYITENGTAVTDIPDADGTINDDARINYIKTHLAAVKRAIDDGADVRGYFYWSLMDNFEWAKGFSKRFGLIRVNYETFERTPKKSAHFYKTLIAQKNR